MIERYGREHNISKEAVDRELLGIVEERVLMPARREQRRLGREDERLRLRGETDSRWAGWLAGKDKAPMNDNTK